MIHEDTTTDLGHDLYFCTTCGKYHSHNSIKLEHRKIGKGLQLVPVCPNPACNSQNITKFK
jgi:hypothetical protein